MPAIGPQYVRVAGFVAFSLAACAFAVLAAPQKADAQLYSGEYDLYQPNAPLVPVGRAWCNGDHTVEYWAYVMGQYQFASSLNDSSTNRWDLGAEHVSTTSYGSYAAFRSAVLALPAMAGKTVCFQSHAVSEEIIDN